MDFMQPAYLRPEGLNRRPLVRQLFFFFQKRFISSNINTGLLETTNRRNRRHCLKTKCTCEESPVGETYQNT